MKYTTRILEKTLKKYLTFFSVVGITGPRQSGKSTLLRQILKNYQYVTFDDQRNQEAFYNDPEQFMQTYQNKIIFDEAQKVPELFNYIKIAVDNDRSNQGKFILTGSSQFAFIRSITESLAGRIGLLTLLPYQFSEIPKTLQNESVYRGGYPELVGKNYQLSDDWFAAYLDTYLNKDVRALSQIGNMRDFQRLVSLLAANTSKILDMSHYARDLGVDVKTIKHWISILEASYIVFLLPPFYNNYGKRITKRPKLYFYDTGLVSYLTGIKNTELFLKGPMAGAIFENYIISEIYKKELHLQTHVELFYYRTSNNVEIDLIVDRKQYKELLEIKLTHTYRPKMLKAIESLIKTEDKGFLIYNGKKYQHSNTITAMPYKDYLK